MHEIVPGHKDVHERRVRGIDSRVDHRDDAGTGGLASNIAEG